MYPGKKSLPARTREPVQRHSSGSSAHWRMQDSSLVILTPFCRQRPPGTRFFPGPNGEAGDWRLEVERREEKVERREEKIERREERDGINGINRIPILSILLIPSIPSPLSSLLSTLYSLLSPLSSLLPATARSISWITGRARVGAIRVLRFRSGSAGWLRGRSTVPVRPAAWCPDRGRGPCEWRSD